jgi:hypothetical protein
MTVMIILKDGTARVLVNVRRIEYSEHELEISDSDFAETAFRIHPSQVFKIECMGFP